MTRTPSLGPTSALIVLALLCSLASSAALAAVHAAPFDRPQTVFLAYWAQAVPRSLVLAAAGVLLGRLVFLASASWSPGVRKRAFLAALVALALAFAELVLLANRRLLPEWHATVSLVTNGVFGLALLALAMGASFAARLPRGRATALTALLLALGTAGVVLAPLRKRAEGPHVFVFLIDVLRADHLGCYGYERATSPNVDRFAREAVLFERAMSQSTYTKTSVASLFTGLNPHRHGVYLGTRANSEQRITSDVLGDDFVTLAEELRDRGFLTLGIVPNGQLRAYMGFDQGFDFYHDRRVKMPPMAQSFRELVQTFGERRRIFSYLHVIDLHAPYMPPPGYGERFGPYQRFGTPQDEPWNAHYSAVVAGDLEPTPADIEHLRALYDGLLSFIDDQFGQILDDLKQAGLYDSSLIVFTADHGEAFFEHGCFSHSSTPFEELVHVPLIVKLPGTERAGLRIAEPVALVDLLPTLLEFAGEDAFDSRDGMSLLAMLEGRSAPGSEPRTIVSEVRSSVAVREGDWKLIDEPFGMGRALYDLGSDPVEKVDRQAEFAEVTERLALRAQAVHALRNMIDERTRVVVDDATIAELRALGYL